MSGRGRAAWLAGYEPGELPPFAVRADLAVFTLHAGEFCTLLVRRGEHPYRGWWALPGGPVRHGRESADRAARRELAEQTGPGLPAAHLEQLATYSAPARDPRVKAGLHMVSIAYVALLPEPPEPRGDAGARWWPVARLGELRVAFDHAEILTDAVERVRAKLEYTTLAAALVREPFSLGDLRQVYLAVWGEAPDLANFRRKVLGTPDFVRPAARATTAPTAAGGRPPELYRRGEGRLISPPLVRHC